MTSRFAVVRICCACRDYRRSALRPREWLLIEWPQDEAEPINYFLSTLPVNTPIRELVRVAKLRWRIARDFRLHVAPENPANISEKPLLEKSMARLPSYPKTVAIEPQYWQTFIDKPRTES